MHSRGETSCIDVGIICMYTKKMSSNWGFDLPQIVAMDFSKITVPVLARTLVDA